MARICVIRQYYFPLDTRVRREVDALVAAGHDVTVVCLRRQDEPRRERLGGLRILRMPLQHRRGGSLPYILEHAAFLALAGSTVALLHVLRRFDVVQVNTMPDTLVFAALVPRLLGARVLIDLHECMPEFFSTTLEGGDRPALVNLLGRLEQLALGLSHAAITCTEQMREAFLARGAPPEKVTVVLNGADEDIFDPRKYDFGPDIEGQGFVLVSHGTVEPRYGLDTAVRAVALLKQEMPNLRLEIYGDGSQLEELRELTRRLSVQDRVWFSGGFVPIDDLVAAIARADAGVVAIKRDSYRDLTLCNKMYDFVTMEKPAIVSRTRSVEDCFGESCFLLFESDDEHDLATAIRTLWQHRELGQRLVAEATRVTEPHRWPRQRQVYLSVVERLVSGESQPAAQVA